MTDAPQSSPPEKPGSGLPAAAAGGNPPSRPWYYNRKWGFAVMSVAMVPVIAIMVYMLLTYDPETDSGIAVETAVGVIAGCSQLMVIASFDSGYHRRGQRRYCVTAFFFFLCVGAFAAFWALQSQYAEPKSVTAAMAGGALVLLGFGIMLYRERPPRLRKALEENEEL